MMRAHLFRGGAVREKGRSIRDPSWLPERPGPHWLQALLWNWGVRVLHGGRQSQAGWGWCCGCMSCAPCQPSRGCSHHCGRSWARASPSPGLATRWPCHPVWILFSGLGQSTLFDLRFSSIFKGDVCGWTSCQLPESWHWGPGSRFARQSLPVHWLSSNSFLPRRPLLKHREASWLPERLDEPQQRSWETSSWGWFYWAWTWVNHTGANKCVLHKYKTDHQKENLWRFGTVLFLLLASLSCWNNIQMQCWGQVALHNGASNEIKEIEVCKKCPKIKTYCGSIFDPIMFKLFWMMQNYPNFVPCVLFVKTVKYWVYFLDFSVKNHEGVVGELRNSNHIWFMSCTEKHQKITKFSGHPFIVNFTFEIYKYFSLVTWSLLRYLELKLLVTIQLVPNSLADSLISTCKGSRVWLMVQFYNN